ncbi:MAG TPA: hypothetical protein VFG04_28325 [Planctomycetaceae bacterium]|jgi:hypothetical protein|nr:hypothetical protein [Planctomycetaceae bacterium]
MQTVFADWASRRNVFPTEPQFETDEDELPVDSDGISARGLEILRVLNDVFNTLPHGVGASRD